MLLSRVAEDLYWMARYLERAQASARAIMEHTNLLVDLPVGQDSDFAPLLAMMGGVSPFDRSSRDEPTTVEARLADEETIIRFLVADTENPGSIISSLAAARQNMRATRQLLPQAAWECLNPLYQRVLESAASDVERSGRAALCADVIRSSQQLLGIFEAMMSRDAAHGFVSLGRQIERADMTTRVLDVRAGSLVATGLDEGRYADVRWLGVLRCLGAHQMYRRTVGSSVEGSAVVDFLLRDTAFPRAVARCLEEIETTLQRLPKNPEAIQACHEMRIQLGSVISGHDHEALRGFLEQLQEGVGEIHHQFENAYFAPVGVG